jgi:uncharacterized membrane protein
MKYSTSIDIGLPIDKVITLFADPELMSQWQEGLVSFEHLEGEPGNPGAKSRLTYRMGKNEIVMEEEIVRKDLPQEFTAVYRAGSVTNWNTNRFEADGESRTLWTQENTFKMKGLMKVMALLSPGSFKRQTLSDMNRFKEFAESRE